MASSSTVEPFSEIRQELEALFSWNPPRLVPAPLPPGEKPSTSTRLPAFYDKHFSDDLILRRVKRLPSLVQDLAKNVDDATLAALDTLPPVDDFITAKHRKRDVANLRSVVTDEKGVADFYDKTTARFCTPVASTLALHPKASFSEWRSLLVWSQSGNTAGYAIADGLLGFISGEDGSEDDKSHRALMVEAMEPQTRRLFGTLRESSSPVGTWEMKNAAAGSNEVMIAVPKLGDFTWTSCTDAECFKSSARDRQREIVALVVVGHDAEDPPWNLDARSSPQI